MNDQERNPAICIATTVHTALDVRIFRKQATSLAAAGYRVTLIAPHDMNEVVSGVQILPLAKPSGRFRRFLSLRHLLRMAIDQDADVYHLHDPELLLICPLLKRRVKAKIILDFHENVVHQIRDKEWIPRIIRPVTSAMYALAETLLLNFVDLIVVAEDSYTENYSKQQNMVCVHNYAIIPPQQVKRNESNKRLKLIYIGGLSEARGILKILEAAKIMKKSGQAFDLIIVGGSFSENFDRQMRQKIREYGLDKMVTLAGWLPFQKAQELIRESDIGLSVLQPVKNYIGSYPTKLFEYMMGGLPVVASDFPIIKRIVDQDRCGLTVDACDPVAIARAIRWLYEHPAEAQVMGERGKKAVAEKYNWQNEEAILLNAYSRLLDGSGSLSTVVDR